MILSDNPKIEIILGDCLEKMKEIPSSSIDLILTDPPYGITACKWDVKINIISIWGELLRISKDRTPILLTASQPFTSLLICSQLTLFRHEWIYKKLCASNFAQAKYAPMKEHESVLVFGKNKPNYYPIKETRKGSGRERAKYKYTDASRKNSGEFVGKMVRGAIENDSGNDELRYPSSVQEFNNRENDRGLHPTQKPKSLMRYFIQTYSQKNDLILDPFMGSGTTLVAAKELGRNAIGIEIDEKYFNIAKNRINQAIKELFI